MHLRARAVTVRFGGLVAVDDVSLTLERGEILGLIGPNGAGKTTLVNVLSGFQRPLAGAIHVGETDCTRLAAPRLSARRDRPHLPGGAPVQGADGQRERRDRLCGAGARPRRGAPAGARNPRRARPRRQGGPAGLRPELRRGAPRRPCPRARRRSALPAPRRAGRRPRAGRGRGASPPDRRPPREIRLRRARHRAQHGARHESLRAHPRARRRPDDRRRHAGRDPRRCRMSGAPISARPSCNERRRAAPRRLRSRRPLRRRSPPCAASTFEVRRRRDRRDRRPERRGQDLAPLGHRRHRRAGRRLRSPSPAEPLDRPRARGRGAAGHRAGAGGPAHLREPHRRTKTCCSARRSGPMRTACAPTSIGFFETFPILGAAAKPAGRPALRRRAAAARDRPRAALAAASC